MTHFGEGLRRQFHLLFMSRLGIGLSGLLVVMCLLTGSVYQQLVIRHLEVAVVDLDNSRISRTLRTALESTPELTTRSGTGESLDALEHLVEQGKLAGYVVIPPGFSEQIKQGKKTTVVVAADMSNLLVGKTLRAATSRVTTTLNVGIEVTVLKKLGIQRHEALPRAYPIVIEDNQLFNPATNYAEYLVPIVLFFLLHIYVTVLWAGTWLEPITHWSTRLGQHAVTSAWCLLLGLGLWWLLPALNVEVASTWWHGGLCWLAYLVAQACFVAAVSSVFGYSRIGFQIVLFFSMLGMMLSGVTWPTYAFPTALARIADGLPFTHLGQLLRMTVHFDANLVDTFPTLIHLVKIATAFFLVTICAQLSRVAWSIYREPRRTA